MKSGFLKEFLISAGSYGVFLMCEADADSVHVLISGLPHCIPEQITTFTLSRCEKYNLSLTAV